jgi:hypothetical protein
MPDVIERVKSEINDVLAVYAPALEGASVTEEDNILRLTVLFKPPPPVSGPAVICRACVVERCIKRNEYVGRGRCQVCGNQGEIFKVTL